MANPESSVSPAERDRKAALRKLQFLMPALFALGFAFFAGITIYPLAGMPSLPLQPFGPAGSPILWFAIACACGAVFALFGALVVAISLNSGDQDI